MSRAAAAGPGTPWAEQAVRMAADAVMVSASLAVSLTLRYLGVVVFEPKAIEMGLTYGEYLARYSWASAVLVLLCLAVFTGFGFYSHGRAYRGRYKALIILQAVTLAFLLFGFLGFLLTGVSWYPRSALFLGWSISAGVLVGSRIWSRLWKWIAAREHGLIHAAGSAEIRRVLVVGGAGYIGSALLPQLLAKGWKVRLLDLCLFGKGPLEGVLAHPGLEIVEGDFRHLERVAEALRDVDAVVHLGGIVGDPACAVDEALTVDVNLVATKMLAELRRGAG